MKKTIIALVLALALLALVLPAAFAAEDTVGATVTAGVVSVTVEDGSVAYGTLSLDSVKNTAFLDGTYNANGMGTAQTQTVTNTSNVAVDLNIKTSAATGGTGWTLHATTRGANQFTHGYNVASSAYAGGSAITFTKWTAVDSYVEVATDLAASGIKYLELEIGMPTTSDTTQRSITVTVQATEATP